MFDLEKSIAEWRKQMLAAGIKAPVPLEELEAHLREELTQQIRSGLDEQRAFEAAIEGIGNGSILKREFAKAKGVGGLLGEDTSTPLERILGALWLVFCLASLILAFWARSLNFLTGPTMMALYGTGLYGSIFLIRGAPMGRRIIRTIAAGFAMISLFLIRMHETASLLTSTLLVFYAVTAYLLFSPSFSKSTIAKKVIFTNCRSN